MNEIEQLKARVKQLENEILRWEDEFGDDKFECKSSVYDKNFKNDECVGLAYAHIAIRSWPQNDICPSCYNKFKHDSIVPNEYDVYTDGSCFGNVANNNPPAGWAFIVVDSIENKEIHCEHNRVVTCREDINFIGADKMSNNTAELSAIYHALAYIKRYYENDDIFTIKYDSEYAAKSVMGVFNGAKNKELINNCRKLLKEITATIKFEHVKAHNGDEYNEKADKLAKEGAALCYVQDHVKPQKKRKIR